MWRGRVGKVPVSPSQAMHGTVLRRGQCCVLNPKKRDRFISGDTGLRLALDHVVISNGQRSPNAAVETDAAKSAGPLTSIVRLNVPQSRPTDAVKTHRRRIECAATCSGVCIRSA
jgi:hypothetical protein